VFDRIPLESSPPRKVVALAYVLEMALIGALVLAPLISTQALSVGELRRVWRFYLPTSPSPPPATQQAPQTRGRSVATTEEILPTIPTTPTRIPNLVEEPAAPAVTGVPGAVNFGGLPRGATDTGIWRMLAGMDTSPPPPPALGKPKPPLRIRQGGVVVAAKAISQPAPDYPPLARMARIQGTVRLEAVISAEGRIQSLKVLAGHPLLVNAALAAVARWRYQPTLLNGEPVEVVTQIDVNFCLTE
jgi:protein TonB